MQTHYDDLLVFLPRAALDDSRRAFHQSNRAYTYLMMEEYSCALDCATAALNLGDPRAATIWRKVCALDGLGRALHAGGLADAALASAEVKRGEGGVPLPLSLTPNPHPL